MEINNVGDLKRAAKEAGVLLQNIHDYCEQNNITWQDCPEARVRFPRGFIRTASLQRKRLLFIRNSTLKDNLAYTLILSDAVLWLKLRTDIWGTPKEMLTKLYIFIIASLCESITKEYFSGVCGESFKKRNKYMLDENIITPELKENLDWLWDTRNKMHLFQLDHREYENNYTHECHKRCVKTYRKLLSALSEYDQKCHV